jgi:hypothetical protein
VRYHPKQHTPRTRRPTQDTSNTKQSSCKQLELVFAEVEEEKIVAQEAS